MRRKMSKASFLWFAGFSAFLVVFIDFSKLRSTKSQSKTHLFPEEKEKSGISIPLQRMPALWHGRLSTDVEAP